MTCDQPAAFNSAFENDADDNHADRARVPSESTRPSRRLRGEVPESVRREIHRQAAYSKPAQLGDVIAVTLANSRVDWRNVSLDDMKRLVVEAVLASRHQLA